MLKLFFESEDEVCCLFKRDEGWGLDTVNKDYPIPQVVNSPVS